MKVQFNSSASEKSLATEAIICVSVWRRLTILYKGKKQNSEGIRMGGKASAAPFEGTGGCRDPRISRAVPGEKRKP